MELVFNDVFVLPKSFMIIPSYLRPPRLRLLSLVSSIYYTVCGEEHILVKTQQKSHEDIKRH